MDARRRIGMVIVSTALAVLAPGPLAAGADDPGKLWRAYPLDQGAAASPSPSPSATPAPSPSDRAPAEPLPRTTAAPARDESGGGLEPLVLALLAALALGAVLLVRLRRGGRSARPSPSPSGPAAVAAPRRSARSRGAARDAAPHRAAGPAGGARAQRGSPATCAIRCRTGVRRAQFYAISFRPDGTWERLGQSAPFPLAGEAIVERSPEAEARLSELEGRLREAGWAPAGDGGAWYERTFQRDGGPG
jgi:hypothetical protein